MKTTNSQKEAIKTNLKLKSIIQIILIILALSAHLYAQKDNIKFERISIEQGLSNKWVTCILQDSKGFLWFGTENGLNKYDGYKFTVYKPDPADSNSLSHNAINSIYQDHLGALWIGTPAGLNRFDQATETFTHYINQPGNPNSLSDNDVWSIYEDHLGMLWIGTYGGGLNRLDLKTETFKHYKNEPTNPNSLSHNSVWSIYEDQSCMLWIGTGGGLDRYDSETEIFTHYQNEPGNPYSLSYNRVIAICEDHSGVLWFGTNYGLNKFDRKTETFKNYGKHAGYSYIESIYEDQSNLLWIGISGGGLNIFDREKETFTQYLNQPRNLKSLNNNCVNTIYQDNSGVLWIGTREGLNKYDRRKGIFTHYRNEADEFFVEPGCSNKMISNYVKSIYQDSAGLLWIGTAGGLNRFNRETKKFKQYLDEFGSRWKTDRESGRSYQFVNSVMAIYEDKSGELWIGTDCFGLQKFDRETETCTPYRLVSGNPLNNEEMVNSIYEDHLGMLWVGMRGGGLNRLDPEKKTWTLFYHPQDTTYLPIVFSTIDSLKNNKRLIASILKVGDSQHQTQQFDITEDTKILIVSMGEGNDEMFDYGWIEKKEDGSTIWKMEANQTRHAGGALKNRIQISLLALEVGNYQLYYLSDDSHSYDNWNEIFPDNPELWGIQIFSITEAEWKKLEKNLSKCIPPSSILNKDIATLPSTITTISGDQSNVLWIGTPSGLNSYNQTTLQFAHYEHEPGNPNSLSNNYVNSICEDQSGVLWIGTSNGLNRFDRTEEIFKCFTERDGLPNNKILGILEDNFGNLWLSTEKGLSKFNLETETFRNFELRDGLQDWKFNEGAYFKSRSGEMFFGGENGFNAFYPDSIKDNPYLPKIVITDFQIFNKSVKFSDENSPLSKHITATDEIVLSYKEYFFSFELTALHYARPEKNQYAYMMGGYDKDWNYIGTRRYATYTNLPPGEYTFRAKGSNCDGVWNEESTSIKITITPPFWVTWWFRSLSAFILLVSGYIVYKKRVATKLEKARILNELKAAHDMQMGLMPTSDPVIEGFDISGICQPAEEVGGDYFDYVWLDEENTRLGIAIVDTSGKAMKGAMTAVMTSGMVYREIGNNESPKNILSKINRPMYLKSDRRVFTAMLFAVIDTQRKILTFSNAGQTQPILKRNGEIQHIKVEGIRFPLGVQQNVNYEEVSIQLQPGDLIIFYTDGVPEAMNEKNEEFDFERIEKAIASLEPSLRAKDIVDRLLSEVAKFSGSAKQHDDMTLVVVCVL